MNELDTMEINAPEMRYLAETSDKSHMNKILKTIKDRAILGEVSCVYGNAKLALSKEDLLFIKKQLASLGFQSKIRKDNVIYITWDKNKKSWFRFWK